MSLRPGFSKPPPGGRAPRPGGGRLGLPPAPKPRRGMGERWAAIVSILTAAAALVLLSMLASLAQRHLSPPTVVPPERALPIADPFEIPPPPPPPPVWDEPVLALPELPAEAAPLPELKPDVSWIEIRPDLEIRPLDLPQPALEKLLQPLLEAPAPAPPP